MIGGISSKIYLVETDDSSELEAGPNERSTKYDEDEKEGMMRLRSELALTSSSWSSWSSWSWSSWSSSSLSAPFSASSSSSASVSADGLGSSGEKKEEWFEEEREDDVSQI